MQEFLWEELSDGNENGYRWKRQWEWELLGGNRRERKSFTYTADL